MGVVFPLEDRSSLIWCNVGEDGTSCSAYEKIREFFFHQLIDKAQDLSTKTKDKAQDLSTETKVHYNNETYCLHVKG